MSHRARLTLAVVITALGIGGFMVWSIVQSIGVPRVLQQTVASIEPWIRDQLLMIANEHLEPKLTFARFEYEYPATAILHDVRLTEDDLDIVRALSLRIVFRETPQRGKPIVIEAIELTQPRVRLVNTESGALRGFSNLLSGRSGETKPDGSSTRVSDVFAIRRITLQMATLTWEPASGPSMELDDINLQLATQPQPDEPGWYVVTGGLRRPPFTGVQLDGRFNIDTGALDVADGRLSLDLLPRDMALLPPVVQEIVREREIRGELDLHMHGLIPLAQVSATDIALHVHIANAHIALGDYQLPIQSMEISGRITNDALAMQPITIGALGGTAQAEATLALRSPFALSIDGDGLGFRIEHALRGTTERSKFSGRVDVKGRAGGSLASLPQSIIGNGSLVVTEGMLLHLPLITELSRVLRVLPGVASGNNDRGDADFQLRGDRAFVERFELISGTIAARGDGDVHYDGRLDLRVNAGVLDQLPGPLGTVGSWFTRLTDKLVTYQVSGEMGRPRVMPRPLGIGVERPESNGKPAP